VIGSVEIIAVTIVAAPFPHRAVAPHTDPHSDSEFFTDGVINA